MSIKIGALNIHKQRFMTRDRIANVDESELPPQKGDHDFIDRRPGDYVNIIRWKNGMALCEVDGYIAWVSASWINPVEGEFSPLLAKIAATDGFTDRLGMVVGYCQNRWGAFHKVLLDGKIEEIGNIDYAGHRGIGYREATEAEFLRIAKYSYEL